jgi:ribosomal RNA assembly protein
VEHKTFTRIPRDRVGVVIGPKGTVKTNIEKTFHVELVIESDTGNVNIIHNPDSEDVTIIFTVRSIIQAIGRGFSPQRAMTLANEDYDIHVIDLEEHVGTSKNAQNRVKGRIIGKGGKSRQLLEELTETQISIYGSTVSVIGPYEALPIAKESIMMLINGAFHKTVWNHLYAYRRKMKKDRGELWYEPPRRRTRE